MIIYVINYPSFAIFTLHRYSVETAPLCKILERWDNYSCRCCISKIWGIQKMSPWMQFWLLSSNWYFCVCSFWNFTPVSNFKEIWQIVLEILHFKDWRIHKVSSRMQFGCWSSHFKLCYVVGALQMLTSVASSTFKGVKGQSPKRCGVLNF